MKSYYSLMLCAGTLWAGSGSAAPSESSPAFETPISIIKTEPASYPFSMFRLGIYEGWTKVYVGVDAQGKLTDALVVAYSQVDFVAPTLEALHQWRYIPASIEGKAVTSVGQLNFNFRHTSSATKTQRMDIVDFYEQKDIQNQSDHILLYSLDQLDRIPTPIYVVAPKHTADDIRRYEGKVITVDFFIDETGTVRLPSLYFPESKEIVNRTLSAVKQWKFEPPTHHNHAVITRVRQEFLLKRPNE